VSGFTTQTTKIFAKNESRKNIGMIYVLHGKDTFRSRHKLTRFIRQAQKQGAQVLEFDFSDESQVSPQMRQLEQSFSSQGLFATKQALIIRDVIGLKTQDQKFLSNLFENRPQTHVVMFFESAKIPASHTFYKKLKKSPDTKLEEYSPFNKKQLQAYTKKRFYEEGKTIRDYDIEKFLQLVGDDLYAIEMSVLKICLVYPEETFIDQTHFDCLEIVSEEPMFTLSKHLFTKNTSSYLKLLTQLERQGTEALMVLGFMRNQLRKALIVRQASQTGQNAQSILGGSPYALKMIAKDTSNLNDQELQNYFEIISDIDRKVKFEGHNVWHELSTLTLSNETH
jgi:DNA polymerase III delta subunit